MPTLYKTQNGALAIFTNTFHWAMAEERVVGFLAITINPARKHVMVEDFYVLPTERRHGYGAAMIQALYQQLDKTAIEMVELTV